jgi:hypothetical protein
MFLVCGRVPVDMNCASIMAAIFGHIFQVCLLYFVLKEQKCFPSHSSNVVVFLGHSRYDISLIQYCNVMGDSIHNESLLLTNIQITTVKFNSQSSKYLSE